MNATKKRDLVYVFTGKITDFPKSTLKDAIKKAELLGEETFKIQTTDGFTIYERFYDHNTDGTKDIITKKYLRENELTPKEAAEAMLNGERLVDYTHTSDRAEYRWDGEHFIVFNHYEYDSSEIIKSFSGLHRHNK